MTMRFVSFLREGRSCYGLLKGDGIVDLSKHHGDRWPTLKAVIEHGELAQLGSSAAQLPADVGIEDIIYDIPVPDAEKIICVGVNYPDRNAEYRDGQEAPPFPSLFIRFARSFVGHDVPLVVPPESEQLDYEGEVVLVIGKGGRRIARERALGHVAGMTLCNEGTIRDWVRHAKFNVTQGKNFDGIGSIGPSMTVVEDGSDIGSLDLQTRVNGEVRQSDNTGRMIFPFDYLISYISTFTTLAPGDLIVTGTPTGAGARAVPPIWLREGDIVEVEASGLGILRNAIRREV